MFKWLFHILIFANSGKYQNKDKPLKRQRKLGPAAYIVILLKIMNLFIRWGHTISIMLIGEYGPNL